MFSFNPVETGTHVLPTRETWNLIVEEISRQMRELEFNTPRHNTQFNEILIKKTDTTATEMGTVVGIGAPIITPGQITSDTDDLAYKFEHIFEEEDSDTADVSLAIMLERLPPKADSTGRALVSGVCYATVNVTDLDHGYAETTATAGELKSTASETSIRILYAKQVGTTERCKVMIGSGGGGGLFPVLLTKTGGSAGDADNKCSFTYTVDDQDGNELETVFDPSASPSIDHRPALGKLVAATAGEARYIAGELSLRVYNERLDPTACEEEGY